MSPADASLSGVAVLVTRPGEAGERLAGRLRELGASVELRPTIALEPTGDAAAADAAIAALEEYDWLVFTSPNGVRFFFDRLSGGLPAGCRAAAIGPATAAALGRRGLAPALTAAESRSEGLARALGRAVRSGQRVLCVRPEVARSVVPDALRALGAEVDSVAFYRNVAAPGTAAVAAQIVTGRYDVVVFTSPSTLHRLRESAADRAALDAALARLALVAIGRTTAAAIDELGLPVAAIAERPEDERIAAAVRRAARS